MRVKNMLLHWNNSSRYEGLSMGVRYPKSVLLISAYDHKKASGENSFESSCVPIAKYILQKGKLLYLEAAVESRLRKLITNSNDSVQDNIFVFLGSRPECEQEIDLVITLGGDGTVLRSVSLFQNEKHVPVFLSFRFGTLGFLTPHIWCPHSFTKFIDKALLGNINVQLRGRLSGQIWKCVVDEESGELKDQPRVRYSRKVLNEVTIHRGLESRVDLDVYVNDNLITTISGDGVLVSTPSGSTAHALSAGASLVHPDVPCIMITPICVHSLSFRPIILPFNSVIKVIPSDYARFHPWVCFDGDDLMQVSNEKNVKEIIVIESAGINDSVPCVCFDDPVNDWLCDLQERLYWNVAKTNSSAFNPLLHSSSKRSGECDKHSMNGTTESKPDYRTQLKESRRDSLIKSASTDVLAAGTASNFTGNESSSNSTTVSTSTKANDVVIVTKKSYSIYGSKLQ